MYNKESLLLYHLNLLGMIFSGFLNDIKIGYLDAKAHKHLTRAIDALQADGFKVVSNHLNNGNQADANPVLQGTISAIDIISDIKEMYIRLRERCKHDKKQLLAVTTDWCDFTFLLEELFVHKRGESAYFGIRAQEILKRFEQLLS